MLIVNADGACWPNPGPASYGIVAMVDGCVTHTESGALGYGTNNIAEWHGALAALEYILKAGHSHVELRMDSRLVIEQLNGRWRVKHRGLKPLASEAARLVGLLRIKGVSLTMRWVPREENTQADALSKC